MCFNHRKTCTAAGQLCSDPSVSCLVFFSAAVCVAGYGKAAGSDVCTLCPYGTYQPGGLTECQACPQTPFYSPVDGNGTTYVSSGTTTYPGSFGIEACVPQQSQLSPEAGQAYFSPDASSLQSLLTSSTQNSLGDCVATCPAGSCCMAQYDVTGKTCKTISLDPQASDASTNMQVVYKLPPSTLGSASSVKPTTRAKMISSGYYAHCSIPSSDVAKWQTAGSDLGADARTFVQGGAVWQTNTDRAACKKACDNSNVCWGFVFDPAQGGRCLFRGGVDALSTRSFFALPTSVPLAQFKW